MEEKDSWDEKNIVKVDVTNPDYLEAIKVAQDNIDMFITVFLNANSLEKSFIKSRFEEDK